MFAHIHVQEMTLGLGLLFGALHALEPGHGKTALFVHLLDGRRSRWVPLTMGLSTAVSHTLSLLLIAFCVHGVTHMIAHGVAESVVPETMRWVSVALILGVGGWMLFTALLAKNQQSSCGCGAHQHETHQLDEHHHGHHAAQETDHAVAGKSDLRTTALLGTAVGLLPCPSALAAYLTGMASGDPADGYLIIVAFGIGIAVSIFGVGLVLQCLSTKLLPLLKMSDRSVRRWNIARAVLILFVGLSYAGWLSYESILPISN
ncbi:HoxN/HupN/NixA family nickel/cobalt transporter [Stratiformator vulcanicus]|uniref:Nickel/cobalt efflux system RcnA n=1 Tax=Stratiformator vulcanicus TaxID=2527980 RepID=A0A517QZ50_9PLAN|nr:sulfite exporter TauE/SafE family protein [Stratiformator vulcanicus]QDT36911.1 Nickel/cobalt efflux system RcnA [Stratiformator vulcanicus]